MSTSINNGIETFTFAEGMIESINCDIVTEIDENVFPQNGPMSNLGLDVNGVIKVIDVAGRLFDTNSTVVSIQNIRDKEVMKFWLEALENGNQQVFSFSSDTEYASVSGSGTSTITDNVSGETITLQASYTSTTVYVKKLTFVNEEGNPQQIPFILSLWVAGS